MALQLIRNNIVNVSADAIVNTANPMVAVGPGVDQAIYEAAGYDELLEARRAIGVMEPGQVAHTPAFALDAKYIIHTIGPAWRGGDYGERETVAKCYRGSLALARELECESIAFPLLATGTYGFPKDEALRIALNEISTFLLDNEMEVMLVVYDKASYEVSGKLFSDIKSFIDEKDVVLPGRRRNEASGRRLRREALSRPLRSESLGRSRRESSSEADGVLEEIKIHHLEEALASYGAVMDEDLEVEASYSVGMDDDLEAETSYSIGKAVDLEDEIVPHRFEMMRTLPDSFSKDALRDRIEHMDKTFQEYLLMLIDRRGLTDPEVYKKANIDRKHFSKIRSNKDYNPSKKTALALAIALELNLDETKDLLARAGLALSPSNIFDLIIEYCITTGNYRVHEINSILFDYEQPTLGV